MSENCETEVYDNYTDLGKCGGVRGAASAQGYDNNRNDGK
jgi:hypothetical protein